MYRSFDSYGRYEKPQMILTNPNGEQLAVLSHTTSEKLKLNFSAYSELDFKISNKVNINEHIPCYDLLQQFRQIILDGLGVFVISSVSEDDNGKYKVKTVKCKTIDALFASVSIVSLDKTIRLYDPTGVEQSIVSMFLDDFPDWNIGYVDSDLYFTYRTYDITEDNWYNFLYNSVMQDFECIIKPNYFTKTLNIYAIKNGISKTDIYCSFENIVKSLNVQTIEDGIQTALEVYGANELTIHDVNPLGTNVIYNFSYYKNTKWIKQETVDAITKWENLVVSKTNEYKEYISQIRKYNEQLIKQKAELKDLQTEYSSIEGVLSARAEQKLDTSEQARLLQVSNNKIANKNNEINTTKWYINHYTGLKNNINELLSFSNNFTREQYIDLRSICIKGTYSNDSYAITEGMTTPQILDREQELMDTAKYTLSQVCQPRYTISSELVNFLALQEFKEFANQLEMGCEITLADSEEKEISLVLMRYELDFSDIRKSKMTFSNTTNLQDGTVTFAELFDGMKSTISKVSVSDGLYKKFIKSGADKAIEHWATESLDLAQKSILSSTNQSVEINQAGLWLRKQLNNGSYDPRQFLMTNNAIIMTDSGWTKTPKLAMGAFSLNGIEHFGCCYDNLNYGIIKGRL